MKPGRSARDLDRMLEEAVKEAVKGGRAVHLVASDEGRERVWLRLTALLDGLPELLWDEEPEEHRIEFPSGGYVHVLKVEPGWRGSEGRVV